MQIFSVTEELLPAFSPLLPDGFSPRSTAVLGASWDDVGCGVIALNIMGIRASICWFWVAPDYRRRGVGQALLHQACVRIFEKMRRPISNITISYPFDADWAPAMELILSREGFLSKALAVQRFHLTREELESAPFLSPSANVDWRGSILSLSALSTVQRNEIRAQYEQEGNYQASRADYAAADPETSHVLFIHDRPAGLTLVQNTAPGVFYLNLFSIQGGCVTGGLALVRCTAQAMLDNGLTELSFDCVEESADRLAHRLLQQRGERTLLCQGQLQQGFYRKGGTNHG